MKSIIIYYSYSGNTRRVANALGACLKEKGEIEIAELKPKDESDKFIIQCRRAFMHEKASLEPLNFDLSQYDLICLGTPVWAFGPAPAMNAFLDKCTGLAGKRLILFVTFGGGLGVNRCFQYMEEVLARKGARDFKRLTVQQLKVKDEEFVGRAIKNLGF